MLKKMLSLLIALTLCFGIVGTASASDAKTVETVATVKLSTLFLANDTSVASELVSADESGLTYRFEQTHAKTSKSNYGTGTIEYVKIVPITEEAKTKLMSVATARGSGSSYQDTYDTSGSVEIYSTVNYQTYNNSAGRECVKMTSFSGGISDVNSGCRVVSGSVIAGQTGANANNGTYVVQSTTKNPGAALSWSYSAPSGWVPLYVIGSGSSWWDPLVGCTYTVGIQRGTNPYTWNVELVNTPYGG